MLDSLITQFDRALRAIYAPPKPTRLFSETPQPTTPPTFLKEAQRKQVARLTRVNHVGEICAQALYYGQAAATDNAQLQQTLIDAAQEEADHLAWMSLRLNELGARPSLLNPLWYTGALMLGWLAGKSGDAIGLGFIVETERQVEQHLTAHLDQLPATDHRSRAMLEQMRAEEISHGQTAQTNGAANLPHPVKLGMRFAAKMMTTTAYWV